MRALPFTLDILPGRKWRGQILVMTRTAHGYWVTFDAEEPGTDAERFVFERMFLTPDQLHDWTGFREVNP